MLKQKFIIDFAILTALVVGIQADALAVAGKVKKEAKFKVRIENISNSDGLATSDGSKYPFAVSPGIFVLTNKKTDFFKIGKKANGGLEAQAEDGNPEILAKKLVTRVGSINSGWRAFKGFIIANSNNHQIRR